MLKDIQSLQQQNNAAALQENGAVFQQNVAMVEQGAANLEAPQAGLLSSADGPKKNIQSALLAIGASGLSTKRGDATDDLLHSTAECSRPGPNVA